jgi:hypothetical protein
MFKNAETISPTNLRLAHECVIEEMSAPSTNRAGILTSQAVSLSKKEENSLRLVTTLSKY